MKARLGAQKLYSARDAAKLALESQSLLKSIPRNRRGLNYYVALMGYYSLALKASDFYPKNKADLIVLARETHYKLLKIDEASLNAMLAYMDHLITVVLLSDELTLARFALDLCDRLLDQYSGMKALHQLREKILNQGMLNP